MSTTILSILLGIGGMVGWGIYDFLGGVFSKQIGYFKSLFWSQLVGLGSILLLASVLKTATSIPVLASLLFPVAAIVYSAGYLFLKAKADAEARAAKAKAKADAKAGVAVKVEGGQA